MGRLRSQMRPKRADLKIERADLRPGRAQFRSERADFRSERADFRLERADFRSERAHYRTDRLNLSLKDMNGQKMDRRTDGQMDRWTNVHLCSSMFSFGSAVQRAVTSVSVVDDEIDTRASCQISVPRDQECDRWTD